MLKEIHRMRQQEERLLSAGLVVFSVATITQLLGRDALDRSLTLALYCMAGSLPLLALLLIANTIEKFYEVIHLSCLFGLLSLLADTWALVGVACVFWHYSIGMGVMFIVSTVLAIVLWMKVS